MIFTLLITVLLTGIVLVVAVVSLLSFRRRDVP